MVLSLLACGPAIAVAAPSGSFAGRALYVAPGSSAAHQAETWRASDPEGAALMDALAEQPTAVWLASGQQDVTATVDAALTAAGDELRSFVVYDIPHRDCGAWSAGGAADAAAYASFVDDVALGLDGREAIVILEPDALPLMDECLDAGQQAERERMLADAVDTLSAAGASVYLDAGDSNWRSPEVMAERLLAAGIEGAAGFSLDVSHTELTEDEEAYAQRLRGLVGEQAHFVIDTSRNGLGPTADNEWCNPRERAVGPLPTLDTTEPGLDALLWVKTPGGSDGSCNGGPGAGAWWPEYARELAANAGL